jgi:hypothetical protein
MNVSSAVFFSGEQLFRSNDDTRRPLRCQTRAWKFGAAMQTEADDISLSEKVPRLQLSV